tara:strand:+ start:197 stop:361 length:165 start_codon:yes stop_codon:yes gene_type:complete
MPHTEEVKTQHDMSDSAQKLELVFIDSSKRLTEKLEKLRILIKSSKPDDFERDK